MSILSCSPLSVGNNVETNPISPTFSMLIAPLETQLPHLTRLVSRSNRPLEFTFSHQVRALIYYHTEACTSGQDLLQAAHADPFVHALMVPDTGLGESTFYEANAQRGSQQMVELVERLAKQASKRLKIAYPELGPLVALDGSLIQACLSMRWAEYSSTQRKAKAHVGFDLNYGIPRRMALTEGTGAERPFVSTLLEPGDTGVLDRGYVDYQRFDAWIDEGKHFVVRIRKNAPREVLEHRPIPQGTALFFFAKVRLGDDTHRMQHPLFLVGFKSRGKIYWVATDRADLSAEQIGFIFLLAMGNRNLFRLVETASGRVPSPVQKSARGAPPALGGAGYLPAVGALFPSTLWRTTVYPPRARDASTHPAGSSHCLSPCLSYRYRTTDLLVRLSLMLPCTSKILTGNYWLD